MMKKETILKTVVCYWSNEDKCYIVESPFFSAVIAADKTADKALKVYKNMLDKAYAELEKDSVHGYKRGRPAKNGVELHIQVQPDTKHVIDELRKQTGISQGEFIDLATFYFAKKAHAVSFKGNLSLESTISELFNMLEVRKSLA